MDIRTNRRPLKRTRASRQAANCLALAVGIAAINISTISAAVDDPLEMESVNVEITKLKSSDLKERSDALLKLRRLGISGEPATPYLIQMLGSEVEFPRKVLMASSKTPMTRSCSDDCTFGGEAAETLACIGKSSDELLSSLKSENRRVRANAIRAIGGLKDRRAISDLLAIVQAPNEHWEERGNALLALGLMGEQSAVPGSIHSLKNARPAVRVAAAAALGMLARPEALGPLLLAVQDPDPRVRRAVVGSLGQLKKERAVEAVVEALQHDKAPVVREVAAAALYDSRDPRAVHALIAALKDEYANVQINAAAALGASGNPEALPPLLTLLKNENEAVRAAAADALGTLGDPHACAGLVGMVRAEQWEIPLVRGLDALSKLGHPGAKALFEEFLRRRPDWKEWWTRKKFELLQPQAGYSSESSQSGSVTEFHGLSLADAPRHTDSAQLPDLFHAVPAGSKSYEIRPEVHTVHLGPEGTVYHIPSKNIFFVQCDLAGSSTMTFYGPFKGDPRAVMTLPQEKSSR